MQAETLKSIDEVSASDWNALRPDDNPFLSHEFLSELERSECVTAETGWAPRHLVLRDGGSLRAAMPLYSKTNSYGEFVFDFAWADAYRRVGLNYYPKLVAAVPFTPARGPRLLTGPGKGDPLLREALVGAATELTRQAGHSSLHVLFNDQEETPAITAGGLLLREDCQFHWSNRGFSDFDDFVGTFSSRKRKKVLRERRRVREAGIRFETWDGADMSEELWQQVCLLLSVTFWRRGRDPYLNHEFFTGVSRRLPGQVVVFTAWDDEKLVGTAVCFRSSTHLYGRYWGCEEFIDSLHFETCYYQGIDYCIREGLQVFEPGTQGEHKVARGFEPTLTQSAHWLADPRFAAAVADYLKEEQRHVRAYHQHIAERSPFRQTEGDAAHPG